jgi:hypothetical protein
MNKEEVLRCIRRNKHEKSEAITLLSDFLVISREEAEAIYAEEIGEVSEAEIKERRYQRNLERAREYYHCNKERYQKRYQEKKRACV